jgi:hypothetical protein
MDHTIKKVIGVAHGAGLEVVFWQASRTQPARWQGPTALSAGGVSGRLAALAGDALPPRRIIGGSDGG